jgi:putative endonuclease
MSNKIKIGKLGEDLAAKYLTKNGYKIITKNYRTRDGEIDLVCQKDNLLVMVEVKTRTNARFGYPEESIDNQKLNKIINTTWHYINQHHLKLRWQIDAISLIINQENQVVELKHFKALDIN